MICAVMPAWAIALIVVAAVLVVAVIAVIAWLISGYNRFVKLRNNVEESFSTMDVYLKKRYDLIPNFVETVKGYAKHENDTLEKVMQARYAAMNATSTKEKAENENILTSTLGKLFAVTENYPNLKANENFLQLQSKLSSLENEISEARKYYNGCVKILNNAVESFPSNLIAKWFKFSKKDLFEIEDKKEREVPQVKF